MERPTTGKRRMRSGSVHVTELIGRERAVHRLLPPEPGAAEAGPAPSAPPGRLAQAAKLAGLGLAVATLCGAVVAASMVADDRGAVVAAPATLSDSQQITGARALLPDELNRAAAEAGAVVPPAPRTTHTTAPSTTASTSSRVPTVAVGSFSAAPTPATTTQDAPRLPGEMSDRELVLEYYRLIESNPSRAFALLSESFDTSLTEFLRSWTSVAAIEVMDVTKRADGVLAAVRMRLVGGTTLRVEQLFQVTETTPRRIVDAKLLSAQLT